MLAGPGEDTMDILQQDALEKGECAGFLQSIEDGDILSLEGVAGLTPLQFFGQLGVESDRSQFLQFFTPFFRVGDKVIDLGVRFVRGPGGWFQFSDSDDQMIDRLRACCSLRLAPSAKNAEGLGARPFPGTSSISNLRCVPLRQFQAIFAGRVFRPAWLFAAGKRIPILRLSGRSAHDATQNPVRMSGAMT